MRVLFVTSEIAGQFKLGGLADVSYALPVALARLGADIEVALPFYKEMSTRDVHSVGQIAVDFAGEREIVFLFAGKLSHASVRLLLFRHSRLDDYHSPDIVSNFAFYSKAVASYVKYAAQRGQPYDIVHCHDWHTALVPVLVGENNKVMPTTAPLQAKASKTILTIHNLLYQGAVHFAIGSRLGLPREVVRDARMHNRDFDCMKLGIEYSDRLTTVSPTYAREITTPAYGNHLSGVLRSRRRALSGIVNGIDADFWNPEKDRYICRRYTYRSARLAKRENKASLQKALHLPVSVCPLVAFIGRLEPLQKGMDVLLPVMKSLIHAIDFQWVILGQGEDGLVGQVNNFAKKHRSRIVFINRFDEGIAHQIYAAADLMVVPSKFEPCGLVQMIAMRYGTVPLVRKTGGLADTVKEGITGFVFEKYTAADLEDKIREAFDVYQNKTPAWQEMAIAVMRQDFSWDKSAKKYLSLYKKISSTGAKRSQIR